MKFRVNGLATLVLLTSSLAATNALAHFPWLIQTEEGKAALFFGENLADRNYALPESISKAKVMVDTDGKVSPVDMQAVEKPEFVGLVSDQALQSPNVLMAQVTYGVYHGARLDYYTLHLSGPLPRERSELSSKRSELGMNAQLVRTEDGLNAFVTSKGKPLPEAKVQLFCEDGHEEAVASTNAEGMASFPMSAVESGLNAILVGYTDEESVGVFDGETYKSNMHYLTATFTAPSDEGDGSTAPQEKEMKKDTSELANAALPFAITSFGAARVGDKLYVYGGHTGSAHSYSQSEQSNQLLAFDLSAPKKGWTKVDEAQRSQGLALVAHGKKLISIGGFEAKNEEGEEHDLHSLASVRAFDTDSGTWTDLPDLPEGRSSHDAAILEDTIYVVGGWDMNGDDETQWQTTALALDLSDAEPQWKEIAQPPFVHRALAVAVHNGKVYAIGGMKEQGGPTRETYVYDPKQDAWSEGPEVQGGSGMAGFGAAAWSINGKLVVSTYTGDIQHLSSDGKEWKVVGETKDARFFHRVLPLNDSSLVSVGGANMEEGKFLEAEVINVQ